MTYFLILQSIGNMGEAVQKFDMDEMYTTEQIVPRLQECIARKDLSHNISMASIQAFRRFNIQGKLYQGTCQMYLWIILRENKTLVFCQWHN